MSKIIIHNPLANQHIDHSHMSNNINVDKQATKRLQEDMNKSYNRLYNSPGFKAMRDLDKNRQQGGHPTDFDNF